MTLTVGAAAVGTVTLRANPGSVGPGGGSVELIATVVGGTADGDGQGLPGVGVTFSADQGTLSASNVTTDASGEARTTLTTSQKTDVSATAGVITSSIVTVTVRAGQMVTITCASGSSDCSAVQAGIDSNTATVLFTIKKETGSSTFRTATIHFGDGSSQSLGNLAGGSASVARTYSGGSTVVSYTAEVQVTDVNGESGAASTTVIITPPAARLPLSVTLTADTTATVVAGVGKPVKLTADVTPTGTDGKDVVSRYEWTFGDGSDAVTNGNVITHVYTTNGARTADVKVTTTDGRTATARVEFIVSGI